MTDVTTIHQPVLLRDCVDLVAPALGEARLDRGGLHTRPRRAFHSVQQAHRLIGIDRDTEVRSRSPRNAWKWKALPTVSRPCTRHSTTSPKCFPTKASASQRGVHGPRIVQPADR